MPNLIQIENPVSACHYTSGNRARRYIAQGRAIWVKPDNTIRFIPGDHRHQAAKSSTDSTRHHYDRAARGGLATIAEVANLPVVNAPRLFLTRTRRARA